MSYRVSTQVYSGPFDLLLQLVTRQKVDIGAISISEVAEQYLAAAACALSWITMPTMTVTALASRFMM